MILETHMSLGNCPGFPDTSSPPTSLLFDPYLGKVEVETRRSTRIWGMEFCQGQKCVWMGVSTFGLMSERGTHTWLLPQGRQKLPAACHLLSDINTHRYPLPGTVGGTPGSVLERPACAYTGSELDAPVRHTGPPTFTLFLAPTR